LKNKKGKFFVLIIKENSDHKGEIGEVLNYDGEFFSVKGLKKEPDLCFFKSNEVKLFTFICFKEFKKMTGISKKQIKSKIIDTIKKGK